MNNTLKIILLNLLLLAPCALGAMNPLRHLGNRIMKTGFAAAAKFKVHTQGLKTEKKSLIKPFRTQGNRNTSGNTNYGPFHASKSLIGAALAGNIQEQLKTSADMPELNVENIKLYPHYKDQFITYAVEHIDQMSPEVIRALLKDYPEAAIKIYEAAMGKMNDNACRVCVRSLIDGFTSVEFKIPQEYKPLLKIVGETLAYYPIVEKIIGSRANFSETNQEKIIHEVVSSAAFDQSTLAQTVCSMLEMNNQVSQKLFKTYCGTSFIDEVYFSSSDAAKTMLEGAMKKYLNKIYNNFVFLPEGAAFNEKTLRLMSHPKYPGWAFGVQSKLRKNPSQTEAHMFDTSMAQSQWKMTGPKVRAMLYAVHNKEIKERAKNNYVFYHGQGWQRHLSADIYKQLWNIAKKDSVGNDFTFLRFDERKEAPDLHLDWLWMNHAIFGNSMQVGSSTMNYFYTNGDNSDGKESSYVKTSELFSKFNMGQLFHKYKNEIEGLENLHQSANRTQEGRRAIGGNGEIINYSGTGNLMLISVPAHKMNNVRLALCGVGTPTSVKMTDGREVSDAKEIVDTLVTNPKTMTGPLNNAIARTDKPEYTLPLTTDYALDPKNGPRIYSFNAADKAKLREYEIARDALFAKIKKDYEQEQAKK